MSSNREIKLEVVELPLTKQEGEGERRELKITLSFENGGMSYFTGTSSPRGYYVHMLPLTVTADGCMKFLLCGSGARKILVEPAARFNAKKLAQLADVAKAHAQYETTKTAIIAAQVPVHG